MGSPIFKNNSDYLYDNNFVVSGAKDHYKHAYFAKINNLHNKNNYAICPVFASMFSDLPHYPRKQYVRRKIDAQPLQNYQDRILKVGAKTSIAYGADVTGADRHRFFSHSLIALTVPKLNLDQESSSALVDCEPNSPVVVAKMLNKKSQTIYRCSSAQTSPWEPPYQVMDSGDPELLKLDFLKWGIGLPVGTHEVTLIERARMKRNWNQALPPMDTKKGLIENTNMIMALEREQWAFREQEIQAMQELRLELLEQMLRELLRNSKIRSEKKLRMYSDMRHAEKNDKLKKLRRNTDREKRRLEWAHSGIINKYTKGNIVDEMANRKSEVYAPILRHGNNPRYWHSSLEKANYKCQYIGVERYNVVPRWLQNGTKVHDNEIKLPGTRLCIRETKWTEPVLKQLHDELKGMRNPRRRKKCTLRTKIDRIPEEPPTPEVDEIEDEEEQIYQASLMIEAMLRGRAAQILIFEGRDRCRELIEELRSSNAVLKKDISEKFENKQEVKMQQRTEEVCLRNINRVQEALKRLEGSVVGTLLDFLNKELTRLLDERKAHALCLVAERERQVREAAEAGKRQLELRRRQEHDEMFKQMAKVTQDTVDLYLENIITEGMEFASSEAAKQFVHKIAVKVDELNAESEKKKEDINYQEEMVADLVHHFVLPEVEKKIVRKKYKNRQAKYLRTAHEEIYGKMDKLLHDKKLQAKLAKRQPATDTPNVSELLFQDGDSSIDSMTTDMGVSEGDQNQRIASGTYKINDTEAKKNPGFPTVENIDAKGEEKQY